MIKLESECVYLPLRGTNRSLGVPCSQYIDDRHIGQLVTSSACNWSDIQKAEAAAYIAISILTLLGYTLALSKSCLNPSRTVKFLGYISNSNLCAFTLPADKKSKFRDLKRRHLSLRNHPGEEFAEIRGQNSVFCNRCAESLQPCLWLCIKRSPSHDQSNWRTAQGVTVLAVSRYLGRLPALVSRTTPSYYVIHGRVKFRLGGHGITGA